MNRRKPLPLVPALAAVFLAWPAVLAAAFEITAPAGSFQAGAELVLEREDIDQRRSDPIAHSHVQADGSIQLELDQPPGLYRLRVGSSEPLRLAPDDGQRLVVTPSPDNPKSLSVSGSPDTDLLHRYESLRRESLARLVYPVREDIKQAKSAGAEEETIAALTQKEIDAYQAHLRELNDFTLDHVGTRIALYYTSLRWTLDYRGEELAERVEAFAKEHGALAIAESMQRRIESSLQTAIGQTPPDLQGKDLEGNTHRLYDYRGRYVLVDFWASWCPPCRVENRHYQKLVERADAEQFVLFSVNLDTTRSLWSRAARQDRISWIQISDLQGLKSPLATAYNVTALPASFLLNPQGEVAAKNLRGEQLDKKLKELGAIGN